MRRLAWSILLVLLLTPSSAGALSLRGAPGAIGATTAPEPPVILHAARVHASGRLIVSAVGTGLAWITAAVDSAADGSWSVPLDILVQTDSSLIGAAAGAPPWPASVLSLGDGSVTSVAVALDGDDPIAPIADLSVASMLDSSGYVYPKDFAFLYDDVGHFHLFYIRHNWQQSDPDLNERSLCHVWSSDLIHWSAPDTSSFRVGPPGQWDARHVWAPSVVQLGPTYFMFYTGVDEQGNQHIGLATATNINTPTIDWHRSTTPLASATDASWANHTAPQQFRDPFVMPDPFLAGHWLMYYTSRWNNGDPADTLCVGVMKSVGRRLTQWTDYGPIREADFYCTYRLKTESPHAFLHVNGGHLPPDSTWYILFTSESNPKSIRLIGNRHSPADLATSYDSNDWTVISNLYDYLGGDTRVSDWNGTEYLRVFDHEYLAGYNAALNPPPRGVNPDSSRIWIVQMEWSPEGPGAPDVFRLAGAVTDVAQAEAPAGLRLRLSRFVPGEADVEFAAEVPRDGPVRLEIFDVLGRRVRTLANESVRAGTIRIPWDCRDGGGARAMSGVYFARLAGLGQSRTVRVPLIR